MIFQVWHISAFRENNPNNFLYVTNNNKAIYSSNDIEAPGLYTIQCYNICKTVVKKMVTIKSTKAVYVHRGSCTPCGKMTHKENLDQSKSHF